MKEIQRRAEYVCRALYFFGKIFAVYGRMLFIRSLFFRTPWRSCRFFT